MLTAKKTLYSGVLLALIVAAMLLSHALQNSNVKKKEAPFYPQFTENFGKIIISKADETVILSREDNYWLAAIGQNLEIKYSADSVKIISILTKISEMKRDVFIGANKEYDEKYGLIGDSAFYVQIFDRENNQIGDFILGKRSENWRFNYFREKNSDKIYLVGGGIGFAFKTDIDEWRNRSLLQIKPEDIAGFDAQYSNGLIFNIKKDGEKWMLDEKYEVNPDSVMGFLKDIAEIDAGSWDYTYSISDEVSGLNNPTQSYVIWQNDGVLHTLLVGNPDSDRPRYFVRANGDPQIAFVFRSQAERLILNKERLTNNNEQTAEIQRKQLEEFEARQQRQQTRDEFGR